MTLGCKQSKHVRRISGERNETTGIENITKYVHATRAVSKPNGELSNGGGI